VTLGATQNGARLGGKKPTIRSEPTDLRGAQDSVLSAAEICN
jgi:hypothetical protein